jgi:hypothetical protein
MALVKNRTDNVFAVSPTVAGVGITMEGIDQNPAYYELYAAGRLWFP